MIALGWLLLAYALGGFTVWFLTTIEDAKATIKLLEGEVDYVKSTRSERHLKAID